MQAQKDFKEFCSLLNTKRVEFLIVGGYAVAFHGAPRFTGDLDILIHPLPEQIERMLEALQAFGFSTQGVSAEYILQQPRILQLGRVPVQIHIMTRITGVAWESAWASRQPGF